MKFWVALALCVELIGAISLLNLHDKKSHEVFTAGAVGMTGPTGNLIVPMVKSDKEIRDTVVRLKGEEGMCSGEQVSAPSGKSYIISAKHCVDLAVDGKMAVQLPSGKITFKRILARDENSDLLILEGSDELPSLSIAASDFPTEKVRTFTHGHNMDTYQTSGEIIQEKMIEAAGPGGIDINFCTVTTASIVPGSSGGVLVDPKGDLVGVASITDGYFSYFVRLSDIKTFLKDK